MTDPWDKVRAQLDASQAQPPQPGDRLHPPIPDPLSASGPSPRASVSQHPVLVSALLGAVGAIAAIPIATFLSAIAVVWIGDSFLVGTLPSDYGEGFGYLLGLYCLVMFPCGAALIGAVPGALLAITQQIRGAKPNPLHPIIAGALTASLITFAASIAAVFLFTL